MLCPPGPLGWQHSIQGSARWPCLCSSLQGWQSWPLRLRQPCPLGIALSPGPGGSGSCDNLWVAFGVLLPVAWKTVLLNSSVVPFCLSRIQDLLSNGCSATPLVFSSKQAFSFFFSMTENFPNFQVLVPWCLELFLQFTLSFLFTLRGQKEPNHSNTLLRNLS